MEEAYISWISRCFPNQKDIPHTTDEATNINLDLGFRYNNTTGVIHANGSKDANYEDPFWPKTLSGSRAPHVRFRRGDTLKSLYDYFEINKFVLLISERGAAWSKAQEATLSTCPLKIAVVPLGEFFSKYNIRESGAVLVRPDGVIAWKAVDDSAVSKLPFVLQRLLGFKVEKGATNGVSQTTTAPERNGKNNKNSGDNGRPLKSSGGFLKKVKTMGQTRTLITG
jgi:hypothetical protein